MRQFNASINTATNAGKAVVVAIWLKVCMTTDCLTPDFILIVSLQVVTPLMPRRKENHEYRAYFPPYFSHSEHFIALVQILKMKVMDVTVRGG